MKFKKIYIEITNFCNFRCSFCFPDRRTKRMMTVEEFRYIAGKIKPFTDYIYLHLLGEPLLHPQLEEILKTANEFELHVNLTTNGSLLKKHLDYLIENPVRQINISIHDAEENIAKEKWEDFLISVFQMSQTLAANTFINLRLWNETNESSAEFNALAFRLIHEFFGDFPPLEKPKNQNYTIARNIFLHQSKRFEWREKNAKENKTCYALKDQIGILSNGDVTPCCIDAEANLRLGNIFRDDLHQILSSGKAMRIKKGFEQRKAVEPYCQKCGFRV